MQSQTVLIVDDDADLRDWIRIQLEGHGFRARAVESGGSALSQLSNNRIDLVLLDCRLPDGHGLDVLGRIKRAAPEVPVIMMTAFGSIDGAVDAVKRHAFHYCQKPLEPDGLLQLVRRALESNRLGRRVDVVRAASGPPSLEAIIGESPAMRRVKRLLQKIIDSHGRSTVLLTGETGTGKDLVAKVVHCAHASADGPFVNVTCSAVPDALYESELFGHERGAFTDAKERKVGLAELAHGGTLFLDEVGELPLGVQAKLLRVLEERTIRRVGGVIDIDVEVRVIAASNRDLEQMVRQRQFREDLYYRLAVIPVQLPPLRERHDDVLLLAENYLSLLGQELGKPVGAISQEARRLLRAYRWPGNVRELRNRIERAVVLCEGPELTPEDFPGLDRSGSAHPAMALPPEGVDLETIERDFVAEALERQGGNQTRAAALLGLSRDQLRYRIEKFGLRARREPPDPARD